MDGLNCLHDKKQNHLRKLNYYHLFPKLILYRNIKVYGFIKPILKTLGVCKNTKSILRNVK